MSKEIFTLLDGIADEMIQEKKDGSTGKLTLVVLATRAGVSLSTTKLPEYKEVRDKLKNAKPPRPVANTNEDAVAWRAKFYELQSSSAKQRREDKEALADARATIDQLVQRLQVVELR